MDTIGGYRLVRRLGAGERAEVFLGHSDSQAAPAGKVAAIKVFRPGIEQRSIDREVAVLAATRSRHLLRLSDLATALDGRQCLVLPRLESGSVARLLADRPTLRAGEVVTILAPLCESLAELHEGRCSHGSLRPGSIFFDRDGAPVLACFGRAFPFGVLYGEDRRMQRATVAELVAEPRVAEDLDSLRTLAGTLVSRVVFDAPTERGDELLAWLDEPERSSQPETFARDLGARLFELARAVPVDIRPIPSAAAASTHRTGAIAVWPSGVVETTGGTHTTTVVATAGIDSLVSSRTRIRGAVIHRARGPLAAWLRAYNGGRVFAERMRAMSSLVRKPFWVMGGIGVSALVLAIALVPSHSGASPDPAKTVSTAAPGIASRNQRPSAVAEPRTAGATAVEGKATDAVGAADNPVAAAAMLLRTRDGCFRKLSLACLNSVDQQGASAADDDSYLIRSLQQGDAQTQYAPLADAEVTLTQRLGDSALLGVKPKSGAETLSMLIMKGESGWRIRDFLQG